MAGTKGTVTRHKIAPKVRAAFQLTLARLADAAKTDNVSALADKIEQSLDEDFLGTLNTLAKFDVKETENRVDVSGTVTHETLPLSESLQIIADAAGGEKEGSTQSTRTH